MNKALVINSTLIAGKNRRVETKFTTKGKSKTHQWYDNAQVLLVVYPDGEVRLSANGTITVTVDLLDQLKNVISYSKQILEG